jgi:hypothetical protein
MSANTAQILALMEGLTAEQLTAIAEQAKQKKKEAKNEKQLLREAQLKEVKDVWEEIEWSNPDEMTNDERIVLLCEAYGLKVAHKRKGRHQDRTIGDATKRPNGQYSNIVANCEERFKYEVMGKAWRGRKIWEGKGKDKVFKGMEFDLQKAFKPIWGKITAEQKKHWHHKFSNEWWKVGDDVHEVEDPNERTNSKAFIAWWDEHITREGNKLVFIGEYEVETDFMKYYTTAVGGGAEKPAEKPVEKPAEKPAKKTKKKTAKKEDKYTALGRKIAKDAGMLVEDTPKTKQKTTRKRRTKAEMAEAKAMGMEDVNVNKSDGVADMFVEEEDCRIFSDDEE